LDETLGLDLELDLEEVQEEAVDAMAISKTE